MLQALHTAGWRNYSLFLRPDGLLIGYFESASTFDEVQSATASTEVNTQWQAEMASMFVDADGAPGSGFTLLEEVFHLGDQLPT